MSIGKSQEQRDTYPLFFRGVQSVKGNDFTFMLKIVAPVLLEFDEGLWYFHGVRPGVICAHGKTKKEAMEAGRREFVEFFEDLAFNNDQNEFISQVERVVKMSDKNCARRWMDAVKSLRAGATIPDEFKRLPRQATGNTPAFSLEFFKSVSSVSTSKILSLPKCKTMRDDSLDELELAA